MIIGPPLSGYPYGGCVLDALQSSPAIAAFNVQRTTASYKGPCINVRRSSDNRAIDIGFVDNSLDVTTLLNFCGSGNGFVTTWYDQSGNSYHATQTTAAYQPQIVSSGVLYKMPNGLPSINFYASFYTRLNIPSGMAAVGNTSSSVVTVGYLQTASSSNLSGLFGDAGNSRRLFYQIGTSSPGFEATASPSASLVGVGSIASGAGFIVTTLFNSGLYLYQRGVLIGSYTPNTGNSVAAAYTIGYAAGGYNWFGGISSMVFFNSALSTANRQTIENHLISNFAL
jgi:hypothetical protein